LAGLDEHPQCGKHSSHSLLNAKTDVGSGLAANTFTL